MGKPISLEGTANTTSGFTNQVFKLNSKLIYITNDSDTYDMLVNFDSTTDQSGAFTVKAGEVISDIPMSCNSVSLQGIGGDVAFRLLGV